MVGISTWQYTIHAGDLRDALTLPVARILVDKIYPFLSLSLSEKKTMITGRTQAARKIVCERQGMGKVTISRVQKWLQNCSRTITIP